MSSYNHIEKIKYNKKPSDVVALKEYILFEDDNAQEKYVVFKFVNNLSQRLLNLKFEIMQYDGDGSLIASSVAVYENFVAESNAEFVPNAKLQVNFECRSIAVNLTYADFDRTTWEGGEFTEKKTKFEEYAATAPVSSHNTRTAAAAADIAPAGKKKSVVFSVKNVSNRNVPLFPRVFNIIACLLVIIFVVVSVILLRTTSQKLYLDGFDLRINGNGVNIAGYDGSASELTIPAKIDKYTVVKIEEGAFKNKGMKKLTIEASKDGLFVEKGAFTGCRSLKEIETAEDAGAITLMEDAFADCTALESVVLPTAYVSANCFRGDKEIRTLTFNDFYLSQIQALSTLFGSEMHARIQTLTLNVSSLPAGFFENAKVGELSLTNNACQIEYGALEGLSMSGYSKNDYCEIVNGEVMSMRVLEGELAIPEGVTLLDTARFAGILGQVTRLTLDTDSTFRATNLLSALTNLKSLTVTKNNSISENTLRECRGQLTEFTAPLLSSPLRTYLTGTRITHVGITGSGTISAAYLAGCDTVVSLNVGEGFRSIAHDAFNGLDALRSLSVPINNSTGTLTTMFTGLDTLTEVEIKPGSSNKTVNPNFFYGLNNLKKITVATGFTECPSNLIANLASLETVVLSGGVRYSFPVIGSGCTSLHTVSASFTGGNPTSYSTMNRSAEYTRNLAISIASGTLTSDFFEEQCGGIERLSITAPTIAETGLLKNCRNISHLELNVSNPRGTYNLPITGLFAGSTLLKTVKLHTLVLNTPRISAKSIFKEDGEVSIGIVVLQNVTAFEGNPFEGCSFLDALILPATLEYNEELFDCFSGMRIGMLYGEGEEPASVQYKGASEWNFKGTQNFFFNFN